MSHHETCVLVVGGGPAGLATAIAARQQGLEVDLLERSTPPIDKACGEGLMPVGREPLAQLGVIAGKLQAREFEGVRYIDGQAVAEGRFRNAKGIGVRRTILYAELLRRAQSLGARCHWRVTVEGVQRGAQPGAQQGAGKRFFLETSAGRWEADWLVAADGLHSRLRRWLRLERRPTRKPRFGVRRHYAVEPWSGFVEVYWSEGCEAYVTPLAGDLVGVAMLWGGRKAGFEELLERFPFLKRRLIGAPAASKDRGAGPFHQRVKAVTRGNVALVGDAAGYVDALTGEGLALAFQQAVKVVDAIQEGDLSLYAAAHRLIVRAPELLTKLTLLLSSYPRLRSKVIGILANDGELFSRLLALQNRDLDLGRHGPEVLGELGLRLLLPPRSGNAG